MIANNIGTNNVAINVENIIPPIIPVPIECLLAAPAPVDIANGNTPNVNANEVITIGLKRKRDASMAAST